MRAENPWTILLFKMRTTEGVERIAVLAVFFAAGWVACSPALAGGDAFAASNSSAQAPASLSYDSPEALARDHERAFRVVATPAARKKSALLLREYFTCVALRDGASSACDAVDSWIGDFAPASCKSRYRTLARRGRRGTQCESAGRKAVDAYAAALRNERKVFAKVWSEILEMRRRNEKAHGKADTQLDRDLAAFVKKRKLDKERRLAEDRLAEDRLEEERKSKLEEERKRGLAEERKRGFAEERERVLEEERKRGFAEERERMLVGERAAEVERQRKREEERAYQAAREADTRKRKGKGLPMRKKTR